MAKRISCPRCGRYQKMNTAECTACGFNFKIAFEKAETRDDKLRETMDDFEKALEKGDKLNAYICLGKLKMLEDPKFHLHCAMVLSRDGEYDLSNNQLALYVYDADDREGNLYLSRKEEEAFPWEMENYALSGRLTRAMIKHYGTQRASVDLYHRLCCVQLAYDNASDNELANWLEIDNLHNSDTPRQIDAANSTGKDEYLIMFLQHLCLDMVHLVLFERKFHDASELDPEIKGDKIAKNTYVKYTKLLTLLPVMDEDGKNIIFELLKTPWEEVGDEDFTMWLQTQITWILFGEMNPNSEDARNYITYFECLQELGLMKLYSKMAQENFEKLLEFTKNFQDEIQHILGTAYYVAKFNGLTIKQKFNEYISKNLDSVKQEEETGEDDRIYSILTKKGVAAMEIAEWEFEQSQAEEFGWRDAGPISLSFFRIIELELNQKLVAKIINQCGIDKIQERYIHDLDILDRHEKKIYKNAWASHIRGLKSIANADTEVDGMLLGPLKDFINDIILYKDTEIGKLIHSKLFNELESSILTSAGYDALMKGKISKVISDEKRTRYRNPPAHTRYLPYSVARECRSFVRESIIKLGEWFN